MNLKVSFSWIGLVIFALPMLINIAYVMFPPAGKAEQTAAVTHWVEIVEQISRIAYLFAVTLLVSRENLSFRSVWFSLAAVFLVLYYAVSVQSFRCRLLCAALCKIFKQVLTSNQSVTIMQVTDWLLQREGNLRARREGMALEPAWRFARKIHRLQLLDFLPKASII